MLTPRTVLVVGVAISAILALVMRKRVRAASFFGGLIITFGVVSLVGGRIFQEWDGGPPVEGSLGVVFSLALIAIGVYLVVYALLDRSGDAPRPDDGKV